MLEQKVVAVVVTHNRKALVVQTLAALKRQTRKLDAIFVIDNASSDDTPDAVRAAGLLDDPLFVHVRLETNTGGAGGFHEGMRRALDAGAEWIWVMDDDVVAADTCLEELLKWTHISECLHPRRKEVDGSDYVGESWKNFLTGTGSHLPYLSFHNGKDILFINTCCFEGMLVSRRLLRICGLPDAAYFISGDDCAFGYKAAVHTNICVVAAAQMKKLLPVRHKKGRLDYYRVRNEFLVFRDTTAFYGLTVERSKISWFIAVQIIRTLALVLRNRYSFYHSLRGLIDGIGSISKPTPRDKSMRC